MSPAIVLSIPPHTVSVFHKEYYISHINQALSIKWCSLAKQLYNKRSHRHPHLRQRPQHTTQCVCSKSVAD